MDILLVETVRFLFEPKSNVLTMPNNPTRLLHPQLFLLDRQPSSRGTGFAAVIPSLLLEETIFQAPLLSVWETTFSDRGELMKI